MRRLLAVLLLVSCSACAHRKPALFTEPRGPADPATRRTIGQGEIVGLADENDTHAWLGLPYAEPPVGALRWKAPRPPSPWQGTREATVFGDPCVQFAGVLTGERSISSDRVTGSEDCLTLNVWAPRFGPDAVPKAAARLPVMVWIHGGGNAIGTGATYSAISNLVAAGKVVAVTVNYRLGVLGWFRHPALVEEGASPEDRSGNWGTLDLIQALRWVQQNAEAFGGDPGNVTVFGESAGGFNVFSLLVSPLAKGLFQRAASQSGMTSSYSIAQAENFTDDAVPGEVGSSNDLLARMLVQEGLAADAAAAKAKIAAMPGPEIARYLREASPARLLAPLRTKTVGMYPSPRILRDGYVQPLAPMPKALADPEHTNRVPVLLGTNRDEFKLFQAFQEKLVRLFFGVLPQIRDQRQYDRFARYLSEGWKAIGADGPAAAMAGSGWKDVYVYRFDWDEESDFFPLHLRRLLGAGHGVEIPFVFHDLDEASVPLGATNDRNREGRRALTEAMSSYWANFARTGRPGRGLRGANPEWRAWDTKPGAPKYLVLDTPAEGGPRMSADEVTLASVKNRLMIDQTVLEEPEEICAAYALLFKYFGQSWEMWDADEYAKLGGGVCAQYPPDEYSVMRTK